MAAVIAALIGVTACSSGTPFAASGEPASEPAPGVTGSVSTTSTASAGTRPGTGSTTSDAASSATSGAGAGTDTVSATRRARPSSSAAAEQNASGFRWQARPLTRAEESAMTGVTWRPGCPVPLSDLRYVTTTHIGFDGRTYTGALVVHRSAVEPLGRAFGRLYELRFPIRAMEPIEKYRGDDYASIEADNTSAFNCRKATNAQRWSRHALGLAVDVNPLENPYVTDGTTSHPGSRPYLDRSRPRPGMLTEGSAPVKAFLDAGWHWGGRWSDVIDLQHFSDSNR